MRELVVGEDRRLRRLPSKREPDEDRGAPGPFRIGRRQDLTEPQLQPTFVFEDEARQAPGERGPEPGQRRVGRRTGGRGEIGEVDETVRIRHPEDRRPPVVGGRRAAQTRGQDAIAA